MFLNKVLLIQKHHSIQKQQGLSLALLLFIIIIIALLATALARLNSQSSLSNAQEIIASRAFFAAESGAQRQAMAIFPVNGSAAVCSNQTYSFNVSGLNGCQAVTSCNQSSIGSETFYQVISRGQCGGGNNLRATRSIEVRLKAIN